MRNQHLNQSPDIEVYGHCRLLLPWLSVPGWFFLQFGVGKLLVWAAGDWIHNLRSLYSVRCLWPLSHCDPYDGPIFDLDSGMFPFHKVMQYAVTFFLSHALFRTTQYQKFFSCAWDQIPIRSLLISFRDKNYNHLNIETPIFTLDVEISPFCKMMH